LAREAAAAVAVASTDPVKAAKVTVGAEVAVVATPEVS